MKRYRIKILLLIELLILITVILFFTLMGEQLSFDDLCKIALVVSIAMIYCVYKDLKKWYSPAWIVFLSFCIFQMGQFYLYAIGCDYRYYFNQRFYMSFTEGEKAVIAVVKYSTLCVCAFAIGMTIAKPRVIFSGKFSIADSKKDILVKVAKILLLISLPAAVIYNGTQLGIVLLSGSGYHALRNGIGEIILPRLSVFGKLAQYYIPSLILLRLELTDKIKIRCINILMLLHFAVFSIIGQRTISMATFAVYIVIKRLKRNKERHKWAQSFLLAGSVALIIVLSVYVGETRSLAEKSISFESITEPFIRFIAECGGSAYPMTVIYSICPSIKPFAYGKAYLSAMVGFFPTFFDFTGTLDRIVAYGNEGWLTEYLGFDFGVGYSLIAESYYNFAWFGWIAIMIIGYLLGKYLNSARVDEFDRQPLFKQYTMIVMLYELVTLPRRGIFIFFNYFFYDVVVIYLLTLIFSKNR